MGYIFIAVGAALVAWCRFATGPVDFGITCVRGIATVGVRIVALDNATQEWHE